MKTIYLLLLLSLSLLLLMLKTNAQIKEKIFLLDKHWVLSPGEETANNKTFKNSIGNKMPVITDVPKTVLGALADAGIYKEIYFGNNLEKIPEEWFKSSWIYTKKFDLPKDKINLYSQLCLEGINYYADVYINEIKIASADTLKGAFRRFDIDITGKLKSKGNKIEIKVYPPQPGDFTVGFVDWTPNPPDQNMGLFRGVHIKFSGPVSLSDPFVKTTIANNYKEAQLQVQCAVINHSNKIVETNVTAKTGDIVLTKKIKLLPFEHKQLDWNVTDNPQLRIKNPRLWWPIHMGSPELYDISFNAVVDNIQSDVVATKFGIREISDYIKDGYRRYKINGKDLQIRGGGWTDDLLLRETQDNVKAQVLYTKQMNLNCIRLEGFWGATETLYNLCDEHGILLMVGWSCQWEWENYLGKPTDEFGGIKTEEDMDLVTQSLKDHVKWLRNHPSIFVWVMGSDVLPRPELEKRYIQDLSVHDPTRPLLMSCALKNSEITGTTGVKMLGPYDYVAPNYWYLDTARGGAYGFNTETGPGPQIPVIETLYKMFPKDSIWPINTLWDYHSGRNEFNKIDRYINALNERYGKPNNIEEFDKKAQLMNYEAIRPMFEAFKINKQKAGGIVEWMLNASWPKLFWQLYDYYLIPTSAFYGTQNALKPINIMYNYGDKNIYLSNDYYSEQKGLVATIRAFDLNSKEIFAEKVICNIGQHTSVKIFDMPDLDKFDSPVTFIDLKLMEGEKVLTNNFYWVAKQGDIHDFTKSKWHSTPLSLHADFTSLNNLPEAIISVTKQMNKKDPKTIDLIIENKSNNIAFFIEGKLKDKKTGDLIAPVYWSNNYISLLPKEKRRISVSYETKNIVDPEVKITGFNTICQD